jgi:molybdopterin-guanine dinucleotide biosynthesis protein A
MSDPRNPAGADGAMIGLVLAGGHSTRMGKDKAAMVFQGTTLLERTVELLRPFCDRVLVAVRSDQLDDPLRSGFDVVVDPPGDVGPAGALLAAWDRHPGRALLVMACDMPRLETTTVEELVRGRNDRCDATALIGQDARPEPLCAIWEYRSYPALALAVAAGRRSPRAFLEEEAKVNRLAASHPEQLQSANRPTDLHKP